jgi:hypothetical protein
MRKKGHGRAIDREWIPLVGFGTFKFGDRIAADPSSQLDDRLVVDSRLPMPGGGGTFETIWPGVQVELQDSRIESVFVHEGPFFFRGKDWLGRRIQDLIRELGGSYDEESDTDVLNQIVVMFDDYGLIARASLSGALMSFHVSLSWLD